MRKEVRRFAVLMERMLRENDHKPGWKGDSARELFVRLQEEVGELDVAVARHLDECRRPKRGLADEPFSLTDTHAELREEAADVANFAMMVVDAWDDMPDFVGEAFPDDKPCATCRKGPGPCADIYSIGGGPQMIEFVCYVGPDR